MKTIVIIFSFLCISNYCFSQVLLEDKDGDRILNSFNGLSNTNTISLIKINTGDQSLGFSHFFSNSLRDPSNYSMHEFAVKAKPTEGYASVFSNGQFSPGVRFSYSFTKVPFIKNKPNWITFLLKYDINKYSLLDRTRDADKQMYTEDFKGFSGNFIYNQLIRSRYIFNLSGGYSRRNNYDDLTSLEVTNASVISGIGTPSTRQVTTKKNVREGNYTTFDSYPMIISLTRATQTDPPGSPAAANLRFGYTLYFKNIATQEKPDQNVGAIFFLTKQAQNGVRNPVFGINVVGADPFDINDNENSFEKRISVGFTTIFSL